MSEHFQQKGTAIHPHAVFHAEVVKTKVFTNSTRKLNLSFTVLDFQSALIGTPDFQSKCLGLPNIVSLALLGTTADYITLYNSQL